jgi:hypothetical protein
MSTEQQVLARAIWFDDEWDKDFIDNAAARSILVVPFDSNTDGLAHLRAHYKDFDVVILDAWGRIQAGSAKAEDPAALGHAKDELQELVAKFGYVIPQCIYSGHLEALDQVTGKAPKFSKKSDKDLDAMFDWIIQQAESRGDTTIQALHADVFAVFDKNLLPDDKKYELIKLLKEVDTKDAAVLKANNALARTFVDAVLEGLNTHSNKVMPEEFRTGTKWNLTYAKLYLTGKPVELRDRSPRITLSPSGKIVPDHLGWMLETIFNAPSSTGSHDYREKHTHYAHRATVNALCELLIWYHDLIMAKHKK